ncbi:hypothetical protein AB6A40_003266 [Gnathostoma spinigerum]|uniref:Oxidation resistance protein 1 n=1 Tax=Gnathostoma spinigerum TaxID=75299 RepID=A0ABD6EBD6_9BILA
MFAVDRRSEKIISQDLSNRTHHPSYKLQSRNRCCSVSAISPVSSGAFPPPILHNLEYDVLLNTMRTLEALHINPEGFSQASNSRKMSDFRSEVSTSTLSAKHSVDSAYDAKEEPAFSSEDMNKYSSVSKEENKEVGEERQNHKRHIYRKRSTLCSLDSGISAEEDDGRHSSSERKVSNTSWSDEFGEQQSDKSKDQRKSSWKFSDSERSEKAIRRIRKLSKKFNQFRKRAFSLPLQSDVEAVASSETSGKPFGSSYLNREWEIVAVREICRRLSLDQINQMVLPIPEGAQSEILDEKMIRQILSVLPARAEGYPWVCVYNSEKHGFSLHTLYRRMAQWNEDMSPILLVIRDCKNHVFGTIVSSALLPSEHFYGTGDSCLLFKFVKDPNSDEKILKSYSWTGENQFFVKASKDSISVGAGGGHYGLWLDADLNHGRSLRCETFANEPLSGDEEDFNIQFVEAFGFRMI